MLPAGVQLAGGVCFGTPASLPSLSNHAVCQHHTVLPLSSALSGDSRLPRAGPFPNTELGQVGPPRDRQTLCPRSHGFPGEEGDCASAPAHVVA